MNAWIRSAVALLCAGATACVAAPPPPPPQPSAYVTIEGDPPVVPWNEKIVDDGGVFEEICVSRLKAMPEKLQWTWHDKLLTQTPEQAYIWRADYSTPRDTDPALLHRVICSLLPTGGINLQIATYQRVERLSISAAELTQEQKAGQ